VVKLTSHSVSFYIIYTVSWENVEIPWIWCVGSVMRKEYNCQLCFIRGAELLEGLRLRQGTFSRLKTVSVQGLFNAHDSDLHGILYIQYSVVRVYWFHWMNVTLQQTCEFS
jgi:hypothetical protein